eukprot:gene2050-biopygen2852
MVPNTVGIPHPASRKWIFTAVESVSCYSCGPTTESFIPVSGLVLTVVECYVMVWRGLYHPPAHLPSGGRRSPPRRERSAAQRSAAQRRACGGAVGSEPADCVAGGGARSVRRYPAPPVTASAFAAQGV